MFDVFYIGQKPNIFVHEKPVVDIQQAQQLCRTRYCWVISAVSDYAQWDWHWEPPDSQTQYTHVWPSQHWDFSGTYLVPKTDSIQYHFNDKIIPNKSRPWDFINLTQDVEFDFSWSPHPLDPPYVYVFGNQWYPGEEMPTVEYRMPGAIGKKFIQDVCARLKPNLSNWVIPNNVSLSNFDFSWIPHPNDPLYVYQFGTQWHDRGGPRYIPPNADSNTPIKYVNRNILRATLLPDRSNWEIPEEVEVDDFDFSWVPHPDDPPYVYQFGTQHQKTGGPRYIAPGGTETKYIFDIRSTVDPLATEIIMMDHHNQESDDVYQTLKKKFSRVSRVRLVGDYFDTIKRIVNKFQCDNEFIWITSSICDYNDFDFSWHPNIWQSQMIHVFPSHDQKFGDTFFISTKYFQHRVKQTQMLQHFELNFVDQMVKRFRPISIKHNQDSQVIPVVTNEFSGPLAIFQCIEELDYYIPTVSLWDEPSKTVVPISNSGSIVLIPRNAIPYIKTQIYDYPYIDSSRKKSLDRPLDIIFISNGESDADKNYQILVENLSNKSNRIVRIDRVKGRVNAYQTALSASETQWAFCVFAKLKIDQNFDWEWQPDYLQQPKHYIFHARNPVNHLEYGHQAMIAYNKSLVLDNNGTGLDFTLDQPHEVVPMLSGVAYYNSDPWTAWRTAFRECIKLKYNNDLDSQYRLTQWLTVDRVNDNISVYSLKGAKDAVEYYDTVSGNFQDLKNSYEWQWLADYAISIGSLAKEDII
jgi:hypothetical protein